VATALNNLGLLYYAQGRYQEAEPLYRRALALREKVLGPDHPDVATSLNNLAGLYDTQGRYKEAEPLYRRALALWEKVLGPEHPDVATALNNLGLLYYAQGRYPEAEPLYRRALALREKVLGPEHPDTARNLFHLAWLLRDKGDHPESARFYHRLVDTWSEIQEQGGLITPEILHMMGASQNNLAFHTEVPAKNWPAAEEHYRQAQELFRQAGQPLEAANVEINLQILFHLSGQSVDIDRVKELTRLLEEAGDKRAEKGRKLLGQLQRGD
jgi:tetratricopeptide (TPR) repeat protein